MPCNCNLCNPYYNTSLDVLVMLREDILIIIKSLEIKDNPNTLDHYKNKLEKVQIAIDNYNPMEG